MSDDIVTTAIRTNAEMIVRGIDDIYRTGRQNQAQQNTPPYAIVRLISNILSIARDNAIGNIASILEVGCGGGHMTRWLRAITRDIVALDASSEAIAVAKASCDYPDVFVVGDGLRPERVVGRKFQLIVISEFHPFKRPILPGHSVHQYHEFYGAVLERYIALLDTNGLIVVAHGINPCEHIDPRLLKTSIRPVEFSPRKFAIEEVFRYRPLADPMNRAIVALTRHRLTCFYLCAGG